MNTLRLEDRCIICHKDIWFFQKHTKLVRKKTDVMKMAQYQWPNLVKLILSPDFVHNKCINKSMEEIELEEREKEGDVI